MIKAIFIDIDGTLRDSERNLSLRTINAVKNNEMIDALASFKIYIKWWNDL